MKFKTGPAVTVALLFVMVFGYAMVAKADLEACYEDNTSLRKINLALNEQLNPIEDFGTVDWDQRMADLGITQTPTTTLPDPS